MFTGEPIESVHGRYSTGGMLGTPQLLPSTMLVSGADEIRLPDSYLSQGDYLDGLADSNSSYATGNTASIRPLSSEHGPHTRQPRPDYGRGLRVKALNTVYVVPSGLLRGGTRGRLRFRGPWSLGNLNVVDYFPPGSQTL